jgi:hypothetical protein
MNKQELLFRRVKREALGHEPGTEEAYTIHSRGAFVTVLCGLLTMDIRIFIPKQ